MKVDATQYLMLTSFHVFILAVERDIPEVISYKLNVGGVRVYIERMD